MKKASSLWTCSENRLTPDVVAVFAATPSVDFLGCMPNSDIQQGDFASFKTNLLAFQVLMD